jgi:hypothetical protein
MRPELLARLHPDLRPFVSLEPHTDADYQALASAQIRRRRKVYSAMSQCIGKRRHPTPDAAHTAARRMGRIGLNTYRCVHCNGWHVGRRA